MTYTFGAGVMIENKSGTTKRHMPIVEIVPNDTLYKVYFGASDIVRNMNLTMGPKGTSTMANVSFLWSFSIDGSNLGTAGCALSKD